MLYEFKGTAHRQLVYDINAQEAFIQVPEQHAAFIQPAQKPTFRGADIFRTHDAQKRKIFLTMG
ncbi:MAG: hypothetical protein ACI4PO_11570 [Faecousia sp.]